MPRGLVGASLVVLYNKPRLVSALRAPSPFSFSFILGSLSYYPEATPFPLSAMLTNESWVDNCVGGVELPRMLQLDRMVAD